MESQYVNPSTGLLEELTVEEYECLLSFVNWFKESKPKLVANEMVVFSEEFGYAGTIDILYQDKEGMHLADFKTGKEVYPEHMMQISAYKHALIPGDNPVQDIKLEIIQLGYKRNKKGYKVTPVEDKFELFLATRQIWKEETEGISPKQIDFPVSLKLWEDSNVKATEQTN